MGKEYDSCELGELAFKRRMLASPEAWPTATSDSSTGDQSKARKAGTLVCVVRVSWWRIPESKDVTLFSLRVRSVTSTVRKW